MRNSSVLGSRVPFSSVSIRTPTVHLNGSFEWESLISVGARVHVPESLGRATREMLSIREDLPAL
jgi:hypothetical protein